MRSLRRRRPSSLRTRFTLGGLGALTLLALLVTPSLLRDAAAAPSEEVDLRLRTVAGATTPALVSLSADPQLGEVVRRSAADVGVQVVRASGPAVRSGPLPPLLPSSEVAGLATVGAGEDAAGWRVLTVTVDARLRPSPDSAVAVQYAVPLDQARAQAAEATSGIVGGVLVLLLVGAALSFAVGGVAARPLRLLRDTTARLRDGARVPTDHRVAEAEDLARAVNALLDRVAEQQARTADALEAARSFTAAASHELRTPLTAISTNVDVLTGYPDLDPAERGTILREVRTDLDRLLSLLGALRELARGDLQRDLQRQPVDLADIADQVVQSAARTHPGAQIELDAPGASVVQGWPDGLRLLVDNLVTNAVLHGRPPVRVRVRAAGPTVRLVVDDAGPGVPPSAREVVFQRFARGRTAASGSGLGLALVAQQVRWHGGTVVVEDAPHGGARFVVELPVVGLAPAATSEPTQPGTDGWSSGR